MIEVDPVCGMEVEFDADTKKNVPSGVFQGLMYFFCAPDCKAEFFENPEEYVRVEAGD